jgi:DNA-binding NtrC family response regulator
MREFLRRARRVAEKDSTLLLLGETGVGKGLLARSIHNEGPRSGKPFVAVNCGALSETLLESELFGHEKGAFTSANRARRGYFELAHGGSIFLDEVSELPLHLQVKLLHVLEDRRIQPVGSERSLCVDVRIIAASNRDLLAEVEQGRFRRDLFYRLNVVSLTLPPLRERVEDIEAMARSYLAHFRERQGGDGPDLSDEALEALRHYSWPGNVREFINAIERACILCEGEEVQLTDLPDDLQTSVPVARGSVAPLRFPDQASEWLELPWNQVRRQVLESAELAYLTGILEATEGRVGEAASRAGMDPRSLFQKMRRYGLRKEDFRSGGASERADAAAPRVPSTLRGV